MRFWALLSARGIRKNPPKQVCYSIGENIRHKRKKESFSTKSSVSFFS
jgi:hypothetical protein